MKKQSLSGDALWQRIREEAKAEVAAEPALASFLNLTVLRHDSLSRVLAFHLRQIKQRRECGVGRTRFI